jgi:phosphate transport system protein
MTHDPTARPEGGAPSGGAPDLTRLDEWTARFLPQLPADRSAEPGPTPRATLDRAKETVEDEVLRMGGLVEAAVRRAGRAIRERDGDAALAVAADDVRINEAQRTVTRLVAVAIATQQPVAGDLRFFLTLYHVAYELERIGDDAAAVARQAAALAAEPPLAGDGHLAEMAERAADVVGHVLTALVDENVEAARLAAAEDDPIDHLYRATFEGVVEMMGRDPGTAERGTRVIIAAHYLERIGDRATNIAEDVVYLVTGEVEDLNR